MRIKPIVAIMLVVALTITFATVSAISEPTEPKRTFVVIGTDERDLPYTLYYIQPTSGYPSEAIGIYDGYVNHMVSWTRLGRISSELLEIIPMENVELVYLES